MRRYHGALVAFRKLKELCHEFYGFIKSRERLIFVTNSYVRDIAFTAVKRDARF